MGVKVYKPVTPSLRNMTGYTFEEITKGKQPERSLLVSRSSQAGRNLYGKVTVRHRGGGERRLLLSLIPYMALAVKLSPKWPV